MTDFDGLDEEIEALEASMAGAGTMASAFHGEMERIRATFEQSSAGARRFENAMSRGVSRAIDGVVLDGMKLSDALRTVAQSMIDASWRAAVKPVADHFGGMIRQGVGSIFGDFAPFAKGGAFTQGRVTPFANGGIVSQATAFPMRGGTGLMGEAGPEAIMPLTRGSDGRLGVRAEGGGDQPVSVVMNITTPDVEGFRRSQTQIAAQMGRMLARGQRNR
ncbi:phage tail tape measure protein [Roseivivax sediminis]|uniref:Phage tail tape measure protein, lambda family n=1 Tax=Roseivivax sediminis TaxID=936889 RepID=A0A1I1TBW3_9RHOB|nr:phage tail tape measure protein [Roseivivax sediminis]SFD53803.1 phage tail tape measure protein, lambda family [Roseivivax sediminis]